MRTSILILLGINLLATSMVVAKVDGPKYCTTNIEHMIVLGQARSEDPASYWECKDGINVLVQPGL